MFIIGIVTVYVPHPRSRETQAHLQLDICLQLA